jgi:hypothetical protein
MAMFVQLATPNPEAAHTLKSWLCALRLRLAWM